MKLDLKKRIKSPGFWLAVLGITSVVFAFLYKFIGAQWLYYAAFAPWGLIIPFTLVGLVFAFIINPYKALKAKRAEKKKEEEEK
mgnify:CR=1 FL=1